MHFYQLLRSFTPRCPPHIPSLSPFSFPNHIRDAAPTTMTMVATGSGSHGSEEMQPIGYWLVLLYIVVKDTVARCYQILIVTSVILQLHYKFCWPSNLWQGHLPYLVAMQLPMNLQPTAGKYRNACVIIWLPLDASNDHQCRYRRQKWSWLAVVTAAIMLLLLNSGQ